MARNTYAQDEELSSTLNSLGIQRLLSYLRPYKTAVIGAIALMVAASLISLSSPFLIKQAIDQAIPSADYLRLYRLAGLLLLVTLINWLLQTKRLRMMIGIGQEVVVNIRRDIFAKLQRLPFPYFDSRPHGKILIRVVNYVNSLSELLSSGFVQFIADLMSLVFIIGFMLVIDARLTLVCMLGLPPLMVAVLAMKRSQHAAWQNVSRKQANLNAYLSESLSGMKVTQSFAREAENQRVFTELSSAWKNAWIPAVRINFLIWPAIDNISTIGIALVYLAGVLIFRNTVTIGTLVAFGGYIWRFWMPIQNIGNFYNTMVTTGAYLEQIFETIDEPETMIDEPEAFDLPPIRGHVEFERVGFSYDPGHPVLNELSFVISPGLSVAIVGPTGAGKTTIVNLLSRFYNPDNGRVLIDGLDLRCLTLNSIRLQVGVMLQDSYLFSGSIRDNIRYGRLDADDAAIETAARAVHAHDFIMATELGYDTQVNERGMRLSAGQRQLISFARVLLADPRILILDEATSAVDTETERAIQSGLSALLKNRTSFIIAHRLSTIREADLILFIDDGRIIESGNHQELLAKRGAYYRLYCAS